LLIHTSTGNRRLNAADGQSVRDVLDLTDLRVRAACGGTGGCGACGVRLLEGEVNPPTLAEHLKLTPEERESGMRLACQLRLRGDAEILLDHPAPPSEWRSIPAEDLMPLDAARPELERHIYGVAVDLGTTHIRIALWDRRHGRRIATRRGLNPQYPFGADVLNRLAAARGRPERAREMAKLARTAIVQAVRDILARDVGEVTPMLAQIGRVLIVGNTAMLALLSGRGSEELVNPDNWQRAIDCRPAAGDAAAWQAEWYMPNAEVLVAPAVAGFIGSDLVADLIATGLTEGPAGSLLVDLGTNTEIALWDGNRLHLTAVPGGPAFEGVGIRHGMPAEAGAICRVARREGCRDGGGGFELTMIGGAAPRGLCGSGLVDGIALMLADGTLKPSGRFAVRPPADGFRLDPANPRSGITGGDVDAFQRAKAATAAAMAELLTLAGMDWPDLRRLCVCGAFGRTLDIANAQRVGLLPPLAPAGIELVADATLAGCEQGLLSADPAALFQGYSGKTVTKNLSLIESYEDRFIDHLRLCPIPSLQR
jgi:uncharacterized 2Fe-2S/4Fe-4S cluster protein (DUF4445 family)